ncbi:MAG: aminotransferase class I/II-fold pyridoxal phosphate-dependent enzyme, partial [SAR324 cluster bacterium]|nr:aminotransferase class I/II-fold pyridoxal phosphate-dependent enzyme [SAR324 cluster bacterium]
EKIKAWEQELANKHQEFVKAGLKLDLTRGKPAMEQLDLADELDGILKGNYLASDGTDTRNYGGLKGLPEARNLGAEWLGLAQEEIIVSGNSSLSLIYQVLHVGAHYGFGTTPWLQQSSPPEFLAIVPGYDRHFGICEKLGIKMVNIPMNADGPDMEMVEAQVRRPQVKGIWCVPKYSNPTGNIYSAEVVDRFARLGNQAAPDFRIMWDNAYAVHDHHPHATELTNLMELCRLQGTEDSVFMMGSSSKVTLAGAGISFLGGSKSNLDYFLQQMACWTIGPDKVNQLRHTRLLPDLAATKKHMLRHAEITRPKFELVLTKLAESFSGLEMGTWIRPEGGYFVSFDSLPGHAKEIVRLAGEAGVKLTPAGSTFPYGVDPEDKNIRLSPTFPTLSDLSAAMEVFVNCVQLTTVRQHLNQ